MSTEPDAKKIDAIFELREAVETKVHAEVDLYRMGTPAARDVLVAAERDVEEKTQEALESCHECGHNHPATSDHIQPARVNEQAISRVGERRENVIAVDFRPSSDSA